VPLPRASVWPYQPVLLCGEGALLARGQRTARVAGVACGRATRFSPQLHEPSPRHMHAEGSVPQLKPCARPALATKNAFSHPLTGRSQVPTAEGGSPAPPAPPPAPATPAASSTSAVPSAAPASADAATRASCEASAAFSRATHPGTALGDPGDALPPPLSAGSSPASPDMLAALASPPTAAPSAPGTPTRTQLSRRPGLPCSAAAGLPCHGPGAALAAAASNCRAASATRVSSDATAAASDAAEAPKALPASVCRPTAPLASTGTEAASAPTPAAAAAAPARACVAGCGCCGGGAAGVGRAAAVASASCSGPSCRAQTRTHRSPASATSQPPEQQARAIGFSINCEDSA
jgi:hypothetical protein